MRIVKDPGLDVAVEHSLALFQAVEAATRDTLGVTRPAYSAQESTTLGLLSDAGERLGLELSSDLAGNHYMTLPGTDRSLPRLLIGSHADSVPQGGNYDGLAGIIAGLACLEMCVQEGFEPRQDISVMGIRGEENAWFGAQHIGSRAALGLMDPAVLEGARRNDSGRTLADHMRAVGLDPEALAAAPPSLTTQNVEAYLELHIEQGPVLVQEGCAVGIVSGIRGNTRCARIVCHGQAGHAGVVPRALRHDAVVAVAELITALQTDWQQREAQGQDLVVTFGKCFTDAASHSITTIPGQVEFCVEIRSHTAQVLKDVRDALFTQAAVIEVRHGVSFEFGQWTLGHAAEMAPHLKAALQDLCVAQGQPVRVMASGAGHDAQDFVVAGIPAAMIFVRNENGSHNPDEQMSIEDFAVGVRLLHGLVRKLAE